MAAPAPGDTPPPRVPSLESAPPVSLRSINDRKTFIYQLGTELSRSVYGSVKLCLNVENGQMMTMKELNRFPEEGDAEWAHRVDALTTETYCLRRSRRNPNVVRYLGTEVSAEHFRIFQEFVPGGTLRSVIARFGALDESTVRTYALQMLRGLSWIHSRRIIHGAISTENAMLTSDGAVKLTGLGFARRLRHSIDARRIASAYKADVWGLGAALLEMVLGRPVQLPCPDEAVRSMEAEIRRNINAARALSASQQQQRRLEEDALLSFQSSAAIIPVDAVARLSASPAFVSDGTATTNTTASTGSPARLGGAARVRGGEAPAQYSPLSLRALPPPPPAAAARELSVSGIESVASTSVPSSSVIPQQTEGALGGAGAAATAEAGGTPELPAHHSSREDGVPALGLGQLEDAILSGYAQLEAFLQSLAPVPDLPYHFSALGKEFIHSCFILNRHARPSAVELLAHAFVQPQPAAGIAQSSTAVTAGDSGGVGILHAAAAAAAHEKRVWGGAFRLFDREVEAGSEGGDGSAAHTAAAADGANALQLRAEASRGPIAAPSPDIASEVGSDDFADFIVGDGEGRATATSAEGSPGSLLLDDGSPSRSNRGGFEDASLSPPHNTRHRIAGLATAGAAAISLAPLISSNSGAAGRSPPPLSYRPHLPRVPGVGGAQLQQPASPHQQQRPSATTTAAVSLGHRWRAVDDSDHGGDGGRGLPSALETTSESATVAHDDEFATAGSGAPAIGLAQQPQPVLQQQGRGYSLHQQQQQQQFFAQANTTSHDQPSPQQQQGQWEVGSQPPYQPQGQGPQGHTPLQSSPSHGALGINTSFPEQQQQQQQQQLQGQGQYYPPQSSPLESPGPLSLYEFPAVRNGSNGNNNHYYRQSTGGTFLSLSGTNVTMNSSMMNAVSPLSGSVRSGYVNGRSTTNNNGGGGDNGGSISSSNADTAAIDSALGGALETQRAPGDGDTVDGYSSSSSTVSPLMAGTLSPGAGGDTNTGEPPRGGDSAVNEGGVEALLQQRVPAAASASQVRSSAPPSSSSYVPSSWGRAPASAASASAASLPHPSSAQHSSVFSPSLHPRMYLRGASRSLADDAEVEDGVSAAVATAANDASLHRMRGGGGGGYHHREEWAASQQQYDRDSSAIAAAADAGSVAAAAERMRRYDDVVAGSGAAALGGGGAPAVVYIDDRNQLAAAAAAANATATAAATFDPQQAGAAAAGAGAYPASSMDPREGGGGPRIDSSRSSEGSRYMSRLGSVGSQAGEGDAAHFSFILQPYAPTTHELQQQQQGLGQQPRLNSLPRGASVTAASSSLEMRNYGYEPYFGGQQQQQSSPFTLAPLGSHSSGSHSASPTAAAAAATLSRRGTDGLDRGGDVGGGGRSGISFSARGSMPSAPQAIYAPHNGSSSSSSYPVTFPTAQSPPQQSYAPAYAQYPQNTEHGPYYPQNTAQYPQNTEQQGGGGTQTAPPQGGPVVWHSNDRMSVSSMRHRSGSGDMVGSPSTRRGSSIRGHGSFVYDTYEQPFLSPGGRSGGAWGSPFSLPISGVAYYGSSSATQLRAHRHAYAYNTGMMGSVGSQGDPEFEMNVEPLIMSDGFNLFDPKLEANYAVGDAELQARANARRAIGRDVAGRTVQLQQFLLRYNSNSAGNSGPAVGEEDAHGGMSAAADADQSAAAVAITAPAPLSPGEFQALPSSQFSPGTPDTPSDAAAASSPPSLSPAASSAAAAAPVGDVTAAAVTAGSVASNLAPSDDDSRGSAPSVRLAFNDQAAAGAGAADERSAPVADFHRHHHHRRSSSEKFAEGRPSGGGSNSAVTSPEHGPASAPLLHQLQRSPSSFDDSHGEMTRGNSGSDTQGYNIPRSGGVGRGESSDMLGSSIELIRLGSTGSLRSQSQGIAIGRSRGKHPSGLRSATGLTPNSGSGGVTLSPSNDTSGTSGQSTGGMRSSGFSSSSSANRSNSSGGRGGGAEYPLPASMYRTAASRSNMSPQETSMHSTAAYGGGSSGGFSGRTSSSSSPAPSGAVPAVFAQTPFAALQALQELSSRVARRHYVRRRGMDESQTSEDSARPDNQSAEQQQQRMEQSPLSADGYAMSGTPITTRIAPSPSSLVVATTAATAAASVPLEGRHPYPRAFGDSSSAAGVSAMPPVASAAVAAVSGVANFPQAASSIAVVPASKSARMLQQGGGASSASSSSEHSGVSTPSPVPSSQSLHLSLQSTQSSASPAQQSGATPLPSSSSAATLEYVSGRSRKSSARAAHDDVLPGSSSSSSSSSTSALSVSVATPPLPDSLVLPTGSRNSVPRPPYFSRKAGGEEAAHASHKDYPFLSRKPAAAAAAADKKCTVVVPPPPSTSISSTSVYDNTATEHQQSSRVRFPDDGSTAAGMPLKLGPALSTTGVQPMGEGHAAASAAPVAVNTAAESPSPSSLRPASTTTSREKQKGAMSKFFECLQSCSKTASVVDA